ncbi:hypothetical protein EL22_20320 [Halostagnicola sp. A56]|uniref:DUF5798 family protein n=1 Tax=Halostagnicola sp. A56 TaxID=1495067 RepID=UPI0004A0BC01|nr:DUF5798 family protein [Halostagnicola sp. A56]KDE59562.1 hypothetical protein EL22_20320 [Halostagnicola sp. A56]
MGLGSTAKKVQTISDMAEKMYKQVQQIQQRIINLEEEVDDTHATTEELDRQLTEQRELLLAIAEEQGIDGEAVLADVAIDDAEADSETDTEQAASVSTDGSATTTEQ